MATFDLAPTTELEAVNYMLLAIGSQPVSTLDSSVSEAYLAQMTLHQVSREIQSEGLHCNFEQEYPLTFDAVTGKITVPSSALRCDVTYPYYKSAVRGGFLYNLEDHTFVWTENVEVDLVTFLDYSDLPQHVRYYIYVRAMRKFQRNTVGSTELENFTARDELEAKAAFMSGEALNEGGSMLNADGAWQILRRRSIIL